MEFTSFTKNLILIESKRELMVANLILASINQHHVDY